jgi:hypothetical protein
VWVSQWHELPLDGLSKHESKTLSWMSFCPDSSGKCNCLQALEVVNDGGAGALSVAEGAKPCWG